MMENLNNFISTIFDYRWESFSPVILSYVLKPDYSSYSFSIFFGEHEYILIDKIWYKKGSIKHYIKILDLQNELCGYNVEVDSNARIHEICSVVICSGIWLGIVLYLSHISAI